MTEAIRTRNPWRTAAMVLIAVLVLMAVALVSMLQPAVTTGSSSPAVHPGVYAPGTGDNYGEGWNNYGHDAPLPQPAQTGNGADDAIDHQDEVIAAYRDGHL